MSDTDRKMFGKFRGTVMDDSDPLSAGRVMVAVPAVTGNALSWALPCLPYSGRGFDPGSIPPIGTHVWVEYEQGDINYPIWCGIFRAV